MTVIDRIRLTMIATALLVAASSFAQTPPTIYRVEAIVLEQISPFAAGEVFDFDDNIFMDASGQSANNAFADDTALVKTPPVKIEPLIGRFERLAAEDYSMTQTVERLTNASRFRVLGHFGWLQEALEPADALAFAVSSRDTDGRVNGTIVLSRSRFLRLDADLTYANGEVTVDMNQSRRRIRTGRLNYLDHPYFGVIFHISRQPQPDSLD